MPITKRQVRTRSATVIGAGSFGTAISILLVRAGIRTSLLARTPEQASTLSAKRENARYLPGVSLPKRLTVASISHLYEMPNLLFLAVPSSSVLEVVEALPKQATQDTGSIISLTKGLLPPDGGLPTELLSQLFGSSRVATVGGPSHAQEMVSDGAGLVAASQNGRLTSEIAQAFLSSGVVCEQSIDPFGVELAGAAKNAATLAAGATSAQGLNATGAAASHIFSEIWEYAVTRGASVDSFVGLAGIGDLVATALAATSRNLQAGELLAAGASADEIPAKIGQAVEALDSVPLLARRLKSEGFSAPITVALSELIAGRLPLSEWTTLVRTSVPPKRWSRQGVLRRWWQIGRR